MSGGAYTRRELVLACAAAGLLPGCQRPSTGPAADDVPAYVPGQPLPWVNWGGNQGCRPIARSAPESEASVLEAMARGGSLRPIGAGHSFSALVPTDGTLIATDLLSGLVSVDDSSREAEVWSGTRLHQLGPLLHARGQAMPNLPDIDYQTLGGAVATSTHGTGAFGSLSAYVTGLHLATPSGELLACSADENAGVFHAARCSLGALGVVTRLRLRNRTPLRLEEVTTFEPLEDVLADVDGERERNRHFEFHALPHSSLAMVVRTNASESAEAQAFEDDPDAVYTLRDLYGWVGRLPVGGDLVYDRLVRAAVAGTQLRRGGYSHQVLTHVRLARFREMEYTVPAEAGPACLREILATIRRRAIPVVFPIEYRYVLADDVWLSMFEGRDGCTISIHQYADEDYRPYFDAIEPIFWHYEGRPHWGKLHSLDAKRLAALYPHWRDFQEVRRELDPGGRLLNAHLRGVLGT